MAPRSELQALLTSLLGSQSVYFQPPPSVVMTYPAIVYSRDDVDTRHANNRPYMHKTRYEVIVIDRNPDSDIHKEVGMLPTSSYNRHFVADGLNHDVYTLYF